MEGREGERGVRRAPNFHRARFITGCARGGEKRIEGKDGGAATHYYEAELPNFAGRYVVSTSSEPHESGRERRAAGEMVEGLGRGRVQCTTVMTMTPSHSIFWSRLYRVTSRTLLTF
ncbi:hypothetical protein ALC56_04403 [Trachymyrmex septentrionalis]|uniref:Uncharacterized protein n=1 Tax=Trachymyrmex septentrionalis TaxID=34720 RepID=A0A195FLX3_9HYME|nr:hypothetical protein ALC56_04403 [Trachymyrmex septentrionalis]